MDSAPAGPPPLPEDFKTKRNYPCPECGGDAEWNPAKQALVCPYCGTVTPFEIKEGGDGIVEHELAAALRNLGNEERGWETEKKSVKCENCHAISVFDPQKVAQRCDFCGSPALIPYEQVRAPIRPESLLAFKISQENVRESVRQWYGKIWIAPNKLKNRAVTDTVHGIYIPYWTFDAQAAADWTAEAGYYYYVTETYRDSQGRSQTRQVQKTRWEHAAGSLEHFFDDLLVPASRGVHPELIRKIEPFPTDELVEYTPAFLTGWVVEQYQIDLVEGSQLARDNMNARLRQLCSQQVPGDTQRNLQVSAMFSGETFKHVLLPIWLLTYQYGRKTYQVVVNGYTGKIAGKYPISWVKVTLIVIAVLIAIAIAMYFGGAFHE